MKRLSRRIPAGARRWVLVAVLFMTGAVALAQWSTPPTWLAGPRSVTVTALHWARTNLLTIAVLGLTVPIVTQFFLRRLNRRDAADERRRAGDRVIMLQRVRRRWITGVLEQSLANEVVIRLGLTRRPDAVLQGDVLLRRPQGEPEPLPTGTPLTQVFDEAGGGLLILGSPGSGKTTALLELARDLLDRAMADHVRAIPVVFNLSSWAHAQPVLAEWLVDELHKRYDVARSIGQQWVDGGEILPLLDGLDEVPRSQRADCVEAINAFQGRRGPERFVVCSRTQEYTTLATQLRVEEAIELAAPTQQQVRTYLEATGTALDDVQAALDADPTLWEFLQSPLVLSIVALTYQDRSADALRAAGTAEQRLAALFGAYTQRMLERRPLTARYTPDRMLAWLAWLARAMRDRSQSEFQLDRLTSDWLPSATQRRRLVRFILKPALIAGLATGLFLGPVTTLIYELIYELNDGLPFALLSVLQFGLVVTLFFGLVATLCFGLFFGLFFSRATGLLRSREAEPVEEVRWSWSQLTAGQGGGTRGARRGGLILGLASVLLGILDALVGLSGEPVTLAGELVGALTLGLAGGLVGLVGGLRAALRSGLFFGLPAALLFWLIDDPTVVPGGPAGQVGRLSDALFFGLASGLLPGLLLGLVFGLAGGVVKGLRDDRTVPNEGIRRSARHALVLGLVGGLGVGLFVWLVFVLILGLAGVGLVFGRDVGLLCGLVSGVCFGLRFGGTACVRHLVLRGLLASHGFAPLRYVRFLDEATERLFLRRAGSGYIFVHRLLLEHFADRELAGSPAQAARPVAVSP